MHTFKNQFKPLLTFFLFLAIVANCGSVFAEAVETTNQDSHHAQNSLDWPGVYQGFIPCDDCKGIKSTLALNKNNSYILITRYVGKSEREFVEKGKFMSGEKSNTLVLTPRDSSSTRQYLVGENTFTQLDKDGNPITGKLADRYILRRTDIKEASQPHASH